MPMPMARDNKTVPRGCWGIVDLMNIRRQTFRQPQITTISLLSGLHIEARSGQAKFVPYAFDGSDVVIADLFSHFADVNIHRSRHDIDIGTPDVSQEIFAREHFVWILSEEVQQFKLFLRQRDHLTF